MTDGRKTRAELLEEVARLRQELAAVKASAPGRPAAPSPDAEADCRRLFGAISGALLVVRVADGRVLHASPSCADLLGVPAARLAAMRLYDLLPPDARDRAPAFLREAASGNRLIPPQDVRYVRPDGRPVSLYACGAITDFGAGPVALIGLRDTSADRDARERLAEAERRYRAVVESAADPIFLFDRAGRCAGLNPAAAGALGLTPQEGVGRRMHDLFPKEVADRQLGAIRRVLDTGTPLFSEEEPTVVREGLRWFSASLVPLRDGEGRPEYVIGIARDVTDRKRAEEALRASEARYRAIVEDQTDLICRLTPDRRATFVNQALLRYFGATADQVLGRDFAPYVHPADRDGVLKALASLTPATPVETHENRAILPNGEVRWIQWTNHALFDDQGRLLEVQGVGRDTTDRRAAEEAVRQSRAAYRALVQASPDAIAATDSDLRVTEVSRRALEVFGYTAPVEVLGQSALVFIDPADHERALANVARTLEEGIVENLEYTFVRKDGSRLTGELNAAVIRDAKGRPARFIATIRDVTERKRLEEDLREALKMEAVGRLAGGIAHDFNNLVTGILCHAGLIKAQVPPGQDTHDSADIIESAARRAADLTSQLLGFARRGKHQDVPVDLNATVRGALRLLGRGLDPRLRIQFRFQEESAWAQGDPAQMEQVVLNLAMNARDAMPDGGDLTVGTEHADLDETACAGRPDARPGRYVVLSVADTGPGVPETLRARIFEPFFTTKPPGRGTGMGLAMVYGIARNHGGWVEVESRPGRGATFRVYWAAAGRAGREPSPPPAAPARRTGQILVVDDEKMIRDALRLMLASLGHTVVAVENGRQAVDYYRAHAADIDLVIIDMVTPEMGGRDCFCALRDINPDVKAVLSTGWGNGGQTQDILDEGMIGFIPKPYQLAQLAEAVRRAMAPPAAPPPPDP